MDFLLFWRIGNTVLALGALLYLMLDLRVMRYELDTRRLFLTFSLAGLLCAVVVGSITHIFQDTALGAQVPIITASCIWCITGLWVSRDTRPSLWKDFPK